MTDMNKEDQELAEIFSGEKRELHPDAVHVTLGQPSKAISKKETTIQKGKDKPVEAQWEPVKERNWLDNLKDCGKWVAVFGGLSILLWYWQVSGLMDASVAVPSMCACTTLAGWNLGKCARGNGMYWYGHDSQTEKGKFCEICGCEHFNEGDICRKCERMLEEYDD